MLQQMGFAYFNFLPSSNIRHDESGFMMMSSRILIHHQHGLATVCRYCHLICQNENLGVQFQPSLLIVQASF